MKSSPPSSNSRRLTLAPPWLAPGWLTPAGILLLALGLRLWRLGDANLWWDEALAIWAVRKGLVGVTLWTAGDVHPPLYFWSLWGWVRLFGESPFAMRALSALFGVLTVAAVYALGTLLAGRRLGNLAALFTALARFHVWWSQEMRMYVLAGLLGMLSLWFFLRWLRAECAGYGASAVPPTSPSRLGPKSLLALYALCSTGALYTIYLMGALLVTQNLVMLVVLAKPGGASRRRLLGCWALAQLGILAALVIWLAASFGRMQTWSVAAPMGLKTLVRLYLTLLTTGVSVDIARYTWPVVLPLAILALGAGCLLWRWRQQRRAPAVQALDILTLTLSCTLTAVLVYVASLPRGLFYTPHVEARYFLPFALAFWLLLAWAVLWLTERWRLAGWLAGIALTLSFALFLPGHYEDRFRRDVLSTLVRTVISQALPGDALLLDSGSRYPILLYDYDRLAPGAWRPPLETVSRAEEPLTPDQVDQALEELTARYRRIWLAEVDVNLSDPERLVNGWLEGHLQVAQQHGYGPNHLTLFAPAGRAPTLDNISYAPENSMSVAVAGGQLAGWEQPAPRVPPGQRIYLSLLWQRAPANPVSLALRNGQGQVLMTRSDVPAPGAAVRQQFDFPVFAATPSGRYDWVLQPGMPEETILGTVRIAGTAPLPPVARTYAPLDIRVGDALRLVGYRLPPAGKTIQAGQTLTLDLYWQADRQPTRDLTVFTHLLGQAHNPRTQGPVWAQHDSQPADGGYPTSQWFVGQVIVDRHQLVIDDQAPSGEYQIEVGMYTWEDGARLPLTGPNGAELGDRLLLDAPVALVALQ
jgi:4-amino-4-deoxy-L-arabinose transferase-like glycosyltransferase